MTDYVKRIRAKVGGKELLQVPSISVAVRDARGGVLMARHSEGGRWLLPGGAIEPGETPADAALRETLEEIGLRVRLTKVVGVFGGPEFIVEYRNGDRTSYVMTVFEAVPAAEDTANPGGEEVIEVRYFSEQESRRVELAPWVPDVLTAVFARDAGISFRPPKWLPT